MKNKTKSKLLFFTITVLIAIIAYQLYNPIIIKKQEKVPVRVAVPVRVPVRIPTEKEYREPPIKEYKPGHVQQMGILVGNDDETLPLYGKEVRGRRDQYHYYTTTPGDQVYPLPVTIDNRDCMDDIGCRELYGNEAVSGAAIADESYMSVAKGGGRSRELMIGIAVALPHVVETF